MYKTNILNKLERKFGKFAISNLMMCIVCGMGTVFLIQFLLPVNLYQLIVFNKEAVMSGQIWRLITFIFIPPSSNYIFIILSLYFYWLLGSSLENEWGAFKFNVFYFCGMIGTIIAGMITGYATNYFINMSLFFAFAILYPNFELMLFFILPVKIKYLAYIDAIFFLYMLIINDWPGRIAIILSLLNLALFFGGDAINSITQAYRRAKWKRNFR